MSKAAPGQKPAFWSLCLSEPFRIFFPVGVLVGISGVSLWPLFFSGIHHGFYPGIMHARMMIEGFMGAFIIGFLGTAAPRLTGTGPWKCWEFWTLLGLYVGAIGTHIAERYFAGDVVYLVLLLFFVSRMAARFARRVDLPPPSFVLVAFGFANAILGVALLIAGALDGGQPRCTQLGSLLLYQGFVTYLVLGIGGFLLPRFLKLPTPEFPESRTPMPGWKAQALIALVVGSILLATFFLEVFSPWVRVAGAIRFLTAALFLLSEVPIHRSGLPRVTIANALRLSLVMLLLGLLFPVLWPMQRVAGLHVVFIGGFTLVTFTVATRVVLGHSGSGHLVAKRAPFLAATALLLTIAVATRVVGDFAPASRSTLLDAASYCWMLAAAVWGWCVLPKVRIADSEE